MRPTIQSDTTHEQRSETRIALQRAYPEYTAADQPFLAANTETATILAAISDLTKTHDEITEWSIEDKNQLFEAQKTLLQKLFPEPKLSPTQLLIRHFFKCNQPKLLADFLLLERDTLKYICAKNFSRPIRFKTQALANLK